MTTTAERTGPRTGTGTGTGTGARNAGWAPLVIVLAGTFVTFLDFFIVNVALPSVGTELHATDGELSLVVAGFGLTFAAGMITGGRLGDLYGRRRMFRLGLALFTLTSAACGFAPNVAVLIAARGAGGVRRAAHAAGTRPARLGLHRRTAGQGVRRVRLRDGRRGGARPADRRRADPG